MEVFRLSREKYASSLEGIGAALRGARWNTVGIELIYTATNRSLAMAEVAVHFTLATLPTDFRMITIEIPDDIRSKNLEVEDLLPNWNAFPHPTSTQTIGDEFVRENLFCLLHIPSVVTKGDYTILINPYHPDFHRIRIAQIEPYPFDKRIFQ